MAYSNIISRLATRFANGNTTQSIYRNHPDVITRDIGGHWRNNHPYISGYFQVMFGLPYALFSAASGYNKTASQWLHSTCESFTPHTQTLNKIDIQGQGQIGSSYASSVTTTREFTMAFREYQNMPIMNIIRSWTSVFDPFTGVSSLAGNQFLPSNYKGWCAVVQTKPVRSINTPGALQASDIEECYIYQGVFPTSIPIDTASAADITSNDSVQLSVTFSFDGAPLTSAENGVTAQVISLFSNLATLNSNESYSATFNNYEGQVPNFSQWSPYPASDTTSNTTPEI